MKLGQFSSPSCSVCQCVSVYGSATAVFMLSMIVNCKDMHLTYILGRLNCIYLVRSL